MKHAPTIPPHPPLRQAPSAAIFFVLVFRLAFPEPDLSPPVPRVAPSGPRLVSHGSAARAPEAEVEILDHLFTDPDPAGHEGKDFLDFLNHNSRIVRRAMCEPSLKDAQKGQRFQFERLAYFVCDEKRSRPGAPVFLRTTTLKDSFQKAQKKTKG